MEHSSAQSRFNVPLILLLCSVAALNYCDRTAVTSVFPLLRKDFGMSDVQLAAIGSLFLWSYALCSPLMGWLADRYSRGNIILISLTAWSLTALWTSFAHSTNEFLATRIALGIAESAYIPAAVGLLAERHRTESQGTAIGFHTASLNVGTIVGATFAGYIGERYGWRIAFLVLAVAGLILAATALPILRERKMRHLPSSATSVSIREGLKNIVHIPSYWILLTQSMIASVSVWMFLNWMPLYIQETFFLSLAVSGFSGSVLQNLPGTFGVVLGGTLSDRVSRTNGARRMLLQSICYLIAAPILLIFLAKPVLTVVFTALFIFYILRSVAMASENPILCSLIASPYRSMAVSLMQTANCIAGGFGILLAGLLKKNYGLHGAFAFMSVLTFIVALLTGIGYRFLLPRDLEKSHSAIPPSLDTALPCVAQE